MGLLPSVDAQYSVICFYSVNTGLAVIYPPNLQLYAVASGLMEHCGGVRNDQPSVHSTYASIKIAETSVKLTDANVIMMDAYVRINTHLICIN